MVSANRCPGPWRTRGRGRKRGDAKRLGKRLRDGHVIAFDGEAGYQATLLMPGRRFRPWLIYSVKKFPWVQIPADGIGVVIAQVGAPLPAGAKSAVYRTDFGNFADVRSFVGNGGQQGVQRPVLPPGTLVPMHPVGFLVLTYAQTFGFPVSPDMLAIVDQGAEASPTSRSGCKRRSCRSCVSRPTATSITWGS